MYFQARHPSGGRPDATSPRNDRPAGTSVETEIQRVVDGDTLVVPIDGDEQRIGSRE
jgi:hypothetical protein